MEIRSEDGVVYRGVVQSIADHVLGELFSLGSETDPAYQRMVIVTDRAAQIRRLEDS